MTTRRSSAVERRGGEVADWIERFCCHTTGEWAGRRLTLEPWQRDLVVELFGRVQRDGRRRYRTALIGIPRKNGKSTLAAALALRLLFADREPGAEVYSVAADRDQARIVFGIAKGMVESTPALARNALVRRNWIEIPRSQSIYRVLSADAPRKHGLNPHAVIFDELHAQPSRELWDVMTSGQGARRQPLTVAITTAGFDRQSICWELFDYGRKVNARVVKDPSFFFRWWGADESAPWDEPATWEAAQPNLGVSVSMDFLEAEARTAKHQPGRQNTFRRLYLNQWTQASSRWIDLGAYDRSAGLVDESTLVGRRCYGGLDLANTTDIAALSWVFPPAETGGQFEALWRFFLPEDALGALDRRTAGQASVWASQGWIQLTEGDVLDHSAVLAQVDRDAQAFDVAELAYDRWGMTQLRNDLADAGMTVVPIGQGFASLSPPTKELERLILAGRWRHGGNPVMRWMMDNVVVRQDPAGNIKPDKAKSTEKIDGVVAAVMALDRATRHEEPAKSVYEGRGLVVG